MEPMQILELWSEVCEKNNVRWALYRETLLCAECLKEFPTQLEYAQVAIGESDLLAVLDNVCPTLEKKLESNRKSFKYEGDLIFKQGDKTVLSVSVVRVELWSDEFENIQVCGRDYPVLLNYRKYLADNYGDYENGFNDNIGVGLTLEEKCELKEHQERCTQALKFLSDLSEKYNLSYFLLAGSVLGSVRHGGFIPWDDDIDVGIRIEDMEAVEKAIIENISTELPSGFTLEQAKPDRKYPRMFSKICFNGRCCIDLWPLTPTYFDGVKSEYIWYYGKMIAKLHYYKLGIRDLKFLPIVRFLCAFLTDKKIMSLSKHNEMRYSEKNAPAYINLYSIYSRSKETIDRNQLEKPEYGIFEGIRVPLVGHTDGYLKHLYGDYMTMPAPWNRASRHIETFNTQVN